MVRGLRWLPMDWVVSGIGKQLAVVGSVGEKFRDRGGGEGRFKLRRGTMKSNGRRRQIQEKLTHSLPFGR